MKQTFNKGIDCILKCQIIEYSQLRTDLWREAGPINHTSKNTPPIIFINSDVPRFHAGRDEMIKRLKSF